MGDAPRSRVLAIMGSGETSPTMVTVHKELAARLGSGQHAAVLLDTPYAFQENAADISARSQAYFARSVGLNVDVVSDADQPASVNPAAAAGAGRDPLGRLAVRRAGQPVLCAHALARRSGRGRPA